MTPAALLRNLRPGLVVLAAMVLTACTSGRVERLSENRYRAIKDPAAVRLYVGPVSREHVEIAWIDSWPDASRSRATRRQQLLHLQRRAARLGADGVIDIRQLTQRQRGFIADPAVPFRAWKQGSYELTFLRGKAVRFQDELPPRETDPLAPEAIPELPTEGDSGQQTPQARPGY